MPLHTSSGSPTSGYGESSNTTNNQQAGPQLRHHLYRHGTAQRACTVHHTRKKQGNPKAFKSFLEGRPSGRPEQRLEGACDMPRPFSQGIEEQLSNVQRPWPPAMQTTTRALDDVRSQAQPRRCVTHITPLGSPEERHYGSSDNQLTPSPWASCLPKTRTPQPPGCQETSDECRFFQPISQPDDFLQAPTNGSLKTATEVAQKGPSGGFSLLPRPFIGPWAH